MTQPNLPAHDHLFTTINDLQVRLGNLERAPQYVVADQTGLQRVVLGLLPSKDFGLAVSDVNGYTTEILPVYASYTAAALSASSLTYVNVSGSPQVSAIIGAGGDCRITCGAYINCPTNTSGTAQLLVDGTPVGDIMTLGSSSPVAANVQSTRTYVGWAGATLSPGLHSFSLQYKTSLSAVIFGANYLEIHPL